MLACDGGNVGGISCGRGSELTTGPLPGAELLLLWPLVLLVLPTGGGAGAFELADEADDVGGGGGKMWLGGRNSSLDDLTPIAPGGADLSGFCLVW